MGFSIYNIKKWYRMLTGKSLLHVNQQMGTCFVPGKIEGYFNDLREKVLKDSELIDTEKLPLVETEKGEQIEFPVAIFQYGLGAYDLFLSTSDEKYLKKFWQCVNWALRTQEDSGAWNNFFFAYPHAPYGAMCQGEAASLLIRAYIQTMDTKYLSAAEKAIEFMLMPFEEGGTSTYDNECIYLYEYTHLPLVLNGWIFAFFGIYDLNLVSENHKYEVIISKALRTLRKELPKFDNGYWSRYDLGGKIASPFYHNLHIAQLCALDMAYPHLEFNTYKQRFQAYQKKWTNQWKAFLIKAVQKIAE